MWLFSRRQAKLKRNSKAKPSKKDLTEGISKAINADVAKITKEKLVETVDDKLGLEDTKIKAEVDQAIVTEEHSDEIIETEQAIGKQISKAEAKRKPKILESGLKTVEKKLVEGGLEQLEETSTEIQAEVSNSIDAGKSAILEKVKEEFSSQADLILEEYKKDNKVTGENTASESEIRTLIDSQIEKAFNEKIAALKATVIKAEVNSNIEQVVHTETEKVVDGLKSQMPEIEVQM